MASIAAGEITPQAVQNAIFGFNQAPTAGRHLLQSATVKVPCLRNVRLRRLHMWQLRLCKTEKSSRGCYPVPMAKQMWCMLTCALAVQNNGVASIASGAITPQSVQNAIFGFNQAPTAGRHLLQDPVKVPSFLLDRHITHLSVVFSEAPAVWLTCSGGH